MRVQKKAFLLLMLIVTFSSCSQERNLIKKWQLIDDPECPDFIHFKDNGKYTISNDCSVKETDTIYHPDIFVVERGNWKLKNKMLLFFDRKIRQYSNFHEYHGVEKELKIRINLKSKDTLRLYFKKDGFYDLKKFETYISIKN